MIVVDLGLYHWPKKNRQPTFRGICLMFGLFGNSQDWAAWSTFTTKVGGPTQVVGDDLTVTNVSRVKKAIEDKATSLF